MSYPMGEASRRVWQGRKESQRMDLENCKAYELLQKRELKDLKAEGYLLRHKKSGAKVALIPNDDENKVFYIGFRTPSLDSTGAAHILEHSVLCGSKRYPVKDPFVELVKSSLNTFLNAMTYPDKTIYPVASCNGKDFQNLMGVYLDAVFYPNIYRHKEIFCQEGWHYELEDMEGPLTVNGVVYNEMKGAFSSPDEVLSREALRTLYPDTSYAFESGGDPDDIPKLSYERFLEFHRKYYHPCNSYIYLYGDMDMEEKLDWMDREYLSKFEKIEVDSALKWQKPFAQAKEAEIPYNVASSEPLEGNAYLSYNMSVGSILDRELYVAFEVLEYVLLNAPGAPLKQALLDAKIGKDITASYDNYVLQPIFSIVAKNSSLSKKEEFLGIIRRVLKEQVENGINEKSLLASLNQIEFRYREADYGQTPKGLVYGIQCLDSWLYGDDPFLHLDGLETVAFLREQVGTGYFERLIQTYFLDNDHAAFVAAKPQYGLNAEKEGELAKRLAAYKESLSEEERREILRFTSHLKQYQEEPSPQEDLDRLPSLGREDIKKTGERLYNREKTAEGVPFLCHDLDTNGIAYFSLMFDLSGVEEEMLPYLGLLQHMLGYVDTESYGYPELANEINLHTGGIFSNVNIYPLAAGGGVRLKYEVGAKALYQEIPKAMEIMQEIVFGSNLRTHGRMHEILAQLRSRMQMTLSSMGNMVSATRAMSYFSDSAKYSDLTQGIAFYQLVRDLDEHFDERKETLSAMLERILGLVFRRENLLVCVGAEPEGMAKMEEEALRFAKRLPQGAEGQTGGADAFSRGKGARGEAQRLPGYQSPQKKNEGFLDASQVQYVSRAGNFRAKGFRYTGALRILQVLLSYDYLWINIRVKGGAYGCMGKFSRNGDSCFSSYRDPNLSQTNEVYEGIPEYLEQFEADEKEMTKYIIGTFSGLDAPLMPSAKARRSQGLYFAGVTEEALQKERDEILNATQEDIRSLAGIVRAVLDEGAFCAIGNEERLKEEKGLFLELKDLY